MSPDAKPAKPAAKPAAKAIAAKATKPANKPATKSSKKGEKAGAGKASKPVRGKGTGAPRRDVRSGQTPTDPHLVLLHPMVTEKTMRLMDENNSLEFLVRRSATKPQVKAAVETLFQAQVETVNTRITKDGKRAIVRFGGETSAEDIGMRIGVF